MNLLPGMFFTICAVGISSPTYTPPIPLTTVQIDTKTPSDTLSLYDFDHIRDTDTVKLIRKAWRGNLSPDEQKDLASYVSAVTYGLEYYGSLQLDQINILQNRIDALGVLQAHCMSANGEGWIGPAGGDVGGPTQP